MQQTNQSMQLIRLSKLATEMMKGDSTAATVWLNAPNAILGNRSPMEHAATEQGVQDIEDLISRIRHGILI